MKKDKESSVLEELFDAIKFYRESKNSKYSLETYLDIIGEYTDQLIKESEEKEKVNFFGGECEVCMSPDTDKYIFSVKIYFESVSGEKIIKEATRSLDKKFFTSDTEGKLEDKKVFEITRPE